MSGRDVRSLVALGVLGSVGWLLYRVVLWAAVLELRRVGPDPLLPEDD
ncbi:hypothetical protein [Curtobacterium sp. L1-20]